MRPLLSWQNITVQQYLDIYRLSLNTDLDDMAKLERVICILFDMTEQQVDNLSMLEFTELSKEVGFIMNGDIPGKPVRNIKVGRKKYSITYDPSKLKHRQYVELIHFGESPIENMHMIMASVVQPVAWYGKKLPNKADDHEMISSDMLQAPVIHVYHACVFFCKIYVSLITNIKDSLVVQMMNQGTSRKKAEELITASINVMAGFIPQNSLQTSKI